MTRLLKIAAVVGIVAASALVGAPLSAVPKIALTDCATATPPPNPTAPPLTPPPTDPPTGQPTPPPNPTPTPAPQNCMPPSGDRIFDTRLLRFDVTPDSGYNLTTVTLSILNDEKNVPPANKGQPVATWHPDKDTHSFGYAWNSIEATPYNGKYKVYVTASETNRLTGKVQNSNATRSNLRVDNPPAQLGTPRIIATTVGSVTLEWDPATEPDVISYSVYRATTKSSSPKPGYDDLEPIGLANGAAYRDTTVKPGFHWYATSVTRRSVVTPDTGITSILSPISSAAEVKSLKQVQKEEDNGTAPKRVIAYRDLAPPRPRSVLASVPDAPFAYKLPYNGNTPAAKGGNAVEGSSTEAGAVDPRGAVLPVAVGLFLVSSALAVGRMPY